MYVTRYGTEENIYEEIGEVSAKRQAALEEEVRSVQSRHRRVLGELNLTVEAMLMPAHETTPSAATAEVQVQPRGPTPADDAPQHQQSRPYVPPAPDLLEDLLRNVGPTDELLSPAGCSLSMVATPAAPQSSPSQGSPSQTPLEQQHDSGFSGSGGSSAASLGGSLRRPPPPPPPTPSPYQSPAASLRSLDLEQY
ncbi:protein EARLY FLOWERING 5-like [Thrips palmi]|uniref:Protein EARLY FLOWERING 5-like n=1 Tax=Thrips palmi TaxID=161013 RepID=A0A6P8ZSV9_THRPL|nr:protein EARLY FLOWERING 5-like [Thrips palmi]